MSSPSIVEYGAPHVSKPKNLDEFKQHVREVHTTSVEMGAQGPLILLGAFLSSSCVLLYRGARYSYLWVQQRFRPHPAI